MKEMKRQEANGINHNSLKSHGNGSPQTGALVNGADDSDGDADNSECPCLHEGKEFLNSVYSFPVDQVYSMIFTKNRFIDDLFEDKKITDVIETQWETNPQTGNKERKLDYNMVLNGTLVKSCHSTDTQVVLKESIPGQLYIIDCEIVNAGVPHSDSFYLKSHYCLTRVSKKETRVQVFGIVKYRKSLWGMIKSMIERTCTQTLSDFCSGLETAFTNESGRANIETDQDTSGISITVPRHDVSSELETSSRIADHKSAVAIRQRIDVKKPRPKPAPPKTPPQRTPQTNVPAAETSNVASQLGKSAELFVAVNIVLLSSLLLLNFLLFYKLWKLEDNSGKMAPLASPQMQIPIGSCFSSENLLRLLKDQETTHRDVSMSWKKAFDDLVDLNRMMGESMYNLKQSIESYANHAVLKNFDMPAELLKSSETNEKIKT